MEAVLLRCKDEGKTTDFLSQEGNSFKNKDKLQALFFGYIFKHFFFIALHELKFQGLAIADENLRHGGRAPLSEILLFVLFNFFARLFKNNVCTFIFLN